MDSLAPYISWVKRNGFWLATAFVAMLLIGGWYTASTEMQTAKTKKIRDYQKSFNDVKSIRNIKAVTTEDGAENDIVAHPNANTQEKMQERLEATADAVVAAWKIKRQQQEALMRYPEEVLGENTYRFFSQSKRPEMVANGERVGRTGETYLRTYGEQIPRKFALIARSISANWKFDQERLDEEARKLAKEKEEMEALGEFGPGASMSTGDNELDTERNKFAVIWEETNQRLWQQKLTRFQNWDDNVKSSQAPTLLQAQILQQDIWLLEAMFNIIKDVNGSATTNDIATIKEIHHIAFGREAWAKLGAVLEADKRLGGAKVPVMGEEGFEGMDGMMEPQVSGIGGLGEEVFNMNADESPFHGRYVNVDLEPIVAEEVRNVVAGKELPEVNLELVVSKRVPFRLGVEMDERKIHAFLAQCANSAFDFEILQVRVNRHSETEAIAFNGGKEENKAATEIAGGLDGPDDGFDFMEMGGMGFEVQKLTALKPSPIETRISYDVNVEFYGVVKLYNPVRENYIRKAVGLPVEQEQPEQESADELPSVAVN